MSGSEPVGVVGPNGDLVEQPSPVAGPWPVLEPVPPAAPEVVEGVVLDETPLAVDSERLAVLRRPRVHAKVVGIHLARLPLYWLRLLARSPRGVARVAGALRGWSQDVRGEAKLAVLADTNNYRKVFLRHEARVASRRRFVRFAAVESVLTLALLVVFFSPVVPAGVWVVVGLCFGSLLGLAGRNSAAPIVSRVVTADSSPPITSDLIITALGALGISELNKAISQAARKGLADGGLGWPRPIREEGKGWRADVDLPPGVTAAQVVERRDRLASGLRRQLSAVWPEPDTGAHAARLVLYVSHKPMSRTKLGAWPLLSKGSVNLFDPFVVGVDPRGNFRSLTLIFAAMLLGAVPRQGKSFAARLILLAAALDPWAELHVYDLKAGADLLPLEPVCHRFLSGMEQSDIEKFSLDLDELEADMSRRYAVIRGLSRDDCPEGKVTPELARRKGLGLHPLVLMVDECQFGFENEQLGASIERRMADLVKRGPAAGIIVILSTQRPDARSLPKSVSDNAVLRFCLKVLSAVANNMVLGPGAYEAGINATQFNRSEKGIGWLVGEEDDPSIVRFFAVSRAEAESVVKRARAARVSLGLLTGQAAGVEPAEDEEDRTTMLDHLAEVWPMKDGERVARSKWEDLAVALADRYPRYVGVKAAAVKAASGLPSVQVKRTVIDSDNQAQVQNRRGAAYEDLLSALAARNGDGSEEDQ